MLFITNAIKMINNYERIIKHSSCTASCRQIKENSRDRKILLKECDTVRRRKYVMVKELAIYLRRRDKLDLFIL